MNSAGKYSVRFIGFRLHFAVSSVNGSPAFRRGEPFAGMTQGPVTPVPVIAQRSTASDGLSLATFCASDWLLLSASIAVSQRSIRSNA